MLLCQNWHIIIGNHFRHIFDMPSPPTMRYEAKDCAIVVSIK